MTIHVKATEQHFSAVMLIILYQVKSQSVIIQMNAAEQYFQ